MSVDNDTIRRLDKLLGEKKELAAMVKENKEAIELLSEALVEAFTADGTDGVTVDGRRAYLHTELWPVRREGMTAEHVIAALRADGLGDLVTENVNANTLASTVRQIVDGGDVLPDHLAAVLTVSPKMSVRVVQGARNDRRANRMAAASAMADTPANPTDHQG